MQANQMNYVPQALNHFARSFSKSILSFNPLDILKKCDNFIGEENYLQTGEIEIKFS
jgi:hypothetical protein